jgi:hypothetical protein
LSGTKAGITTKDKAQEQAQQAQDQRTRASPRRLTGQRRCRPTTLIAQQDQAHENVDQDKVNHEQANVSAAKQACSQVHR